MTAGKKETLMLVLAGIIPVTWLGLKFAPFYAQELITAFAMYVEVKSKYYDRLVHFARKRIFISKQWEGYFSLDHIR